MSKRFFLLANRPKTRSRLRIKAGKCAFTLMRYLSWYTGRIKYASQRSECRYRFHVYEHRTPLVRRLKNLDMWLQQNKVTNLGIAAQRLNGIIVRPQETFSYWKLIGKPSRSKGYKPGLVLDGGRMTAGVGGGLCQLSNLIYWMTLHTPLTVTERYRHSYDVFPDSDRTQPFGSGATCVYNYRDLQILNQTCMAFQLLVYLTPTHLAGEWRCDTAPGTRYEVYEKNHCIKPYYPGGYLRCNEIYRRVYGSDGSVAGDEFIVRNEALMLYPPFLGDGNDA